MSAFAVLGATGAQGGAVVTALLEQGATVRGITRRTDSPAARRLTDAGVEVVAADLSDPGSVSVDQVVVQGRAADAILAQAGDAQLIVVGTHGIPGWRTWDATQRAAASSDPYRETAWRSSRSWYSGERQPLLT